MTGAEKTGLLLEFTRNSKLFKPHWTLCHVSESAAGNEMGKRDSVAGETHGVVVCSSYSSSSGAVCSTCSVVSLDS